MAQNLSSQTESKRRFKKKVYEDFIMNDGNKGNNKAARFACKGCSNIFKNKKTLLHHQAVCLTVKVNLTQQGSFFGDHFTNKTELQGTTSLQEKILPASQPLVVSEVDSGEVNENSNPTLINQAMELQNHQTDEMEIPVSFINETDTTITPSSFPRDDRILPNLPVYEHVEKIPTQDYNQIDGHTLVEKIEVFYEAVVRWQKNHFQLPTGQSGKKFITLLTDWLKKFNAKSCFQGIAMKVFMVLPSLMLQKPSAKSKAKDHSALLEERLKLWEEGNIDKIFEEAEIIQKKMISGKKAKSDEDITRIFSKLVLEGKLGPALKFLDEQAENAVLPATPEVINKMKELHPEPSEIKPFSLFHGPVMTTPPAYFYSIDEDQIRKAANATNGSGGPSLLDAQHWRRILTSNKFKMEGKELREQLALFARRIATETVDPAILEAYVACRSIPLNKNPDEESIELQIRPIGVGEVIRRIVGKAQSWCLSSDIQEAAGPLQVSAGLKGGAEAAIHAMKEIYNQQGVDGVILVDARNAFNSLNRMVALHNIQYLCPPFALVLINTYRTPTRLFIGRGGEIESKEGNTQGDTLAMPFYGISVKPLIDILKIKNLSRMSEPNIIKPSVSQAWLADDASAAAK